MAVERAVNMSDADSDISLLRADFPILEQHMNGKRLAFLDSAASAQKPRVVIDAMAGVMEQGYANIHRGLYQFSQQLTTRCEDVRSRVARFLGAESEKEIVFTANATDSMNLVAQGWGAKHLAAGDEVILSAMEHHANIVPWQILRARIGFEIKVIPVLEDATLDMEAFEALLGDKTRLIGLVHVSNALGTINPVKEVIAKAKAFNPDIKVLVDGSQSAVHMPVDVRDLGCDFFAFTAHKLYGPTGLGVLYGRYDVLESMMPFRGGGDMIEDVSFDGSTYKEPPYRFEAGTPPIVEIVGLGAAIAYMQDIGMDVIAAHEQNLANVGDALLRDIDGLRFYSNAPDRVGIFSFNLDGAHASDVGMILDQCGVAVRTGHHCCMPLMKHMGVDATVRASLGLYSDMEDLEQLAEAIKKAKDMLL